MGRPGKAAAAEASGLNTEVASILLHHQVGGCLGNAKQAVHRRIDTHALIDAVNCIRIAGSHSHRVACSMSGRRFECHHKLIVGAPPDKNNTLRRGRGNGPSPAPTRVPLAFTVKSSEQVTAAQSCDGCAAVWITAAMEPAYRRNTRSIATSASRISASGNERITAHRRFSTGAGSRPSAPPSARKNTLRMSLSMPTTKDLAIEEPGRLGANKASGSCNDRYIHFTVLGLE